MTKEIFIKAKPPAPKTYVSTSPSVTTYRYIGERLVSAQRPIAAPMKKTEKPNVLFCPNCASIMTTEFLGGSTHQCSCSTCGLSGPRKPTAKHAIEAVKKFFFRNKD